MHIFGKSKPKSICDFGLICMRMHIITPSIPLVNIFLESRHSWKDDRNGPYGPLKSQTSALFDLDASTNLLIANKLTSEIRRPPAVSDIFLLPQFLPGARDGSRCANSTKQMGSTPSLSVRVGQMRKRRDLEVGHNTWTYMPGFQIPPDKADGCISCGFRPGARDGSRCAKAGIFECGIVHSSTCRFRKSPLTKQMGPYRAPGLCVGDIGD